MNWVFLPPWSTRAIALAGIGLILLAGLRWWQERRGGGLILLRTVVIGVLLVIMLNPQSLLPRERTTKPKLVVLLDSSSSMATRDANGGSRLETAVEILNDDSTLATLNREFTLDFRRFDRDTRPLDSLQWTTNTPNGDATDIGSALLSAVSELGDAQAQAGILLVSDGRATTPDTLAVAQLALARSVPLWTWTVGGPVPRHDLWIETSSTEALAFSGTEVELAATLHQVGYPNRSFNVEVLRDEMTIETQEVIPDTNGVARAVVRVKAPESGEQRYVFRVGSEPEEMDVANNSKAVFLRSVGEKVRVLVAEGQPHWDTKFLVQSLKRNPHVDLTAVYRLNALRHVAIVSATGEETRVERDLFPRTADAMNAFDVIVLGREAETFFDNETDGLLTDFVARRGGSLVFARGKPYGGRFQPLAKLEPLAWGNGTVSSIKLRPTEAGRDNPIFDLGASGTLEELLNRLPALDHASVTLGEKPLAVILANAAQQDGPVLVAYQRFGQGKAISLNASGLWRWSFRETDQEESEAAYQRFWISLLQWLLGGGQFLPGADVALTSSRRYYTSEQPMQFLVTTRNLDRVVYQPRITIDGGGKIVQVEPRSRGDAFIAEAGPFPPGSYRVTLKNNTGSPAQLSQSIEVLSASVEKRELSADPELMKELAETSGGTVVNAGDIARMPDVVQRWEAARQLAHRQRPMWDRWWVIGAMFVLLGAEWWLRRREGLL